MVIKYYHGNLPLEKISRLCKTTQKGTSAYHLIEAASELGFEAKGMHCTKERLYEGNILLPTIAYVTIDQSYNHYVVLYEINMHKRYLWVADPADKMKKISFENFEKIYNETIILLKPMALIPCEEKEMNVFELFFYLLQKYKRECFYFIFLSLFFSIFSILTSFYLKYMIDAVEREASASFIQFLFLLFFFLTLLQIFTFYLRNQILLLLNQKIDFVFTSETLSSILSLPYPYYHTHTIGEMHSKIDNLNHVKENIGFFLGTLFVDLPLSLMAYGLLFYMHHTLALFSFVFAFLYSILGFLFYKIFKKWIAKFQEKNELVQNFITETMKGFETIQGLHIQKKILEVFKHHYLRLSYAREGLQNKNNLFMSFLSFIEKGSDLILVGFGVYLIQKGEMGLGSLLSFLSLTAYFLNPFKNFGQKLLSIEEALTSMKRISSLFFKEEEIGYLERVEEGDLTIRDLTYSFDEQKEILSHLSFSIKKGSKVLLLGKSGLGKSTLLKLLMKYYTTEKKMIWLGNSDLLDYKKRFLHNSFLYISQNEILFTATLYQNITLWEEVEERKLQKVIQICALEEVIAKNKVGLSLIIEENGTNLSGGERQRVILARALLKNFSVLLIDEGFSEMDVPLEKKILQNIFRYFPLKTILVVSHRTSNVDLFDQVLRFEEKNKVLDIRKMPNGKYMVYQ